jgi:AbiV family abortive infection protein
MMEPLEIWADKPDAVKQLESTAATLHVLKAKKLELQLKGRSLVKAQPSRIPENALAEGAALSYQNAWQFLDDAELLLSHDSFGHATSLAMYALEEYAKSAVIQAMEFDSNLRDDLSERIALRNHVGKFMVALEAIRMNRKIEITAEAKRTIIETSGKLQSLKERGLYVDYLKKWLAPFSQDIQNTANNVVKETRDLMTELKDLMAPSGVTTKKAQKLEI